MTYYTDAVKKAAERLVTDENDADGKTIAPGGLRVLNYGPATIRFTDGTIAVLRIGLDYDGDPQHKLDIDWDVVDLEAWGLVTKLELVQECNARSLALFGKPIPYEATIDKVTPP